MKTNAANFLAPPLPFFQSHHAVSPLVSLITHQNDWNICYCLLQQRQTYWSIKKLDDKTRTFTFTTQVVQEYAKSGVSNLFLARTGLWTAREKISLSGTPKPLN